MLSLKVKFSFEAAHNLPNYNGPCSKLHGHTYHLEVEVDGQVNEESGMIVDFGVIKRIIKENVIDKLDHNYVNNVVPNPTAENIMLWIIETLTEEVPMESPFHLKKLTLWETDNNAAVWRSE